MSLLDSKVGTIFLPGDQLLDLSEVETTGDKQKNIHFGPGIRQDGKNAYVCKAGVLKKREKPLCFWIDTNQKRYVPVKNDTVIGIVTSSGTESFKVDIGTSKLANLHNLAFEGATKKHRPKLKSNDIVFAKVTLASKDMEPELTCIDENQRAMNMGPLSDGYMFTVSLNLCRQLLRLPECLVLKLLGKHFPFEIVVGLNGRVWIHSKGIIDMIAIANAIVSSEFMEAEQISFMIKQLIESISGIAGADDDEDEEDLDDDMGDEG